MAIGKQLSQFAQNVQSLIKQVPSAFKNDVKNFQQKGGTQGGLLRVQNALTSNPGQFNILNMGIPGTPLSIGDLSLTQLKSQAVPSSKIALSPLLGQQRAEDIGYGLQGALNLTPFQSNPAVLGFPTDFGTGFARDAKAKIKEASSTPVTDRQKTAERIGRFLYGSILTAPVGPGKDNAVGMAVNVGNRALMGASLGTGLQILGSVAGGPLQEFSRQIKEQEPIDVYKIISQSKLPDANVIKEGVMSGVENSWKLAITDMALDLAVSAVPASVAKYVPFDLTQEGTLHAFDKAKAAKLLQAHGGSITNFELAKYYTLGALHIVTRALLEAPGEDLLFTAEDIASGKDKRPFLEALIQNLPQQVAGNLMYAGFQIATNAPVNVDKSLTDIVKKSVGDTLSQGKELLGQVAWKAGQSTTAGIKRVVDFDKYIPDKLRGTQAGERIKQDLSGKPEPVFTTTQTGKKLLQRSGTQDPVITANEALRYNAAFQIDDLNNPRNKLYGRLPEGVVEKINDTSVAGASNPREAAKVILDNIPKIEDAEVKSFVENTISQWATIQTQVLQQGTKYGLFTLDPETQKVIDSQPGTDNLRTDKMRTTELDTLSSFEKDGTISPTQQIRLNKLKKERATLPVKTFQDSSKLPVGLSSDAKAQAGFEEDAFVPYRPGRLTTDSEVVGVMNSKGELEPTSVRPNLFAVDPKSGRLIAGHTEGDNFGIKFPFDQADYEAKFEDAEGVLKGSPDTDSLLQLGSSQKYDKMVRAKITEDGIQFLYDPKRLFKMNDADRIMAIRTAAQTAIDEGGLSPNTPVQVGVPSAQDPNQLVGNYVKGSTLGELARVTGNEVKPTVNPESGFIDLTAPIGGTKPSYGEKLESAALGKYGLAETPEEAAFISRKGELISGTDQPGSGVKNIEHGDIARQAILDNGKKAPLLREHAIASYMDQTGDVRITSIDDVAWSIQINSKPTEAQYKAIDDLMTDGRIAYVELTQADGSQWSNATFDNPDQVRSYIDKRFSQAGFARLPIKKESKTTLPGLKKPVEDLSTAELAKRVKTNSPYKDVYKAELENRVAIAKMEQSEAKIARTALKVAKDTPKGPPKTVEIKDQSEAKVSKAEMKKPRITKNAKVKTSKKKVDPREKYVFNINKDKMLLSEEGQRRLQDTVDFIRPQLEEVKGKKLTNQEVLEAAQVSNGLRRIIPRKETKELSAALLRLRSQVVEGAEGEGITADFVEDIKILSSWSRYAGTILGTFNIDAEPMEGYVKEKFVREMLDTGADTDAIVKAAEGVDFNNPVEVTRFYRQFVKPSIGDILDEYRYFNLLSSPQTHIVNGFSNMLQATTLAPGVKLYSGGIDWIANKLTGKEQEHYISEVPAYFKGFKQAIPEAVLKWQDVLNNKTFEERPDMRRIPTGIEDPEVTMKVFGEERPAPAALRAFWKVGGVVTKNLEAADIFFRTLIKSGEMEALTERATKQGKDIPEEVIEKLATDRANYWLFRQPIDPTGKRTGQGYALQQIDALTSGIYALRKVKAVKWFVPFLQTPVNILKQGLEFSPLGFGTQAGMNKQYDVIETSGTGNVKVRSSYTTRQQALDAIDQIKVKKPKANLTVKTNTSAFNDGQLFDSTEQLAKAFIGSTVFLGASFLAGVGKATFAPPRGEKERQIFYASGRKPYSIQVYNPLTGKGEWVSYSRIGPLAYPIAMAAALKYYVDEAPTAYTDSALDKTRRTLLSIMGFFSDQSYMQGLGDFIKVISGEDYAVGQAFSNTGRQLVPLTSLLGWTARLIDPIYRDPKGNFIKNIQAGMPFLSFGVEPHLDPLGQPSVRQRRFLNAITATEFSPENPMFEELWQTKVKVKQINNIKDQLKNGDISEEDAIRAINNLMSDVYGNKASEDSILNLLASPVSADEPQRETFAMLFTWNPKTGLYEDNYGNPGPDQPDHVTSGSSYVYEFKLNPETGKYEDDDGNLAPIEITIESQNPEQSLEGLIELGQQNAEGSGALASGRLKIASGTSSSVKVGKVPTFDIPKFTPKNTELKQIRLSNTSNRVSRPKGYNVSQFQARLPAKTLRTSGLVRAR